MVKRLVTVAGSPYGTLATIVIMNPWTKQVNASAPLAIPIKKKIVAVQKEITVMYFTKRETSKVKVVYAEVVEVVA